MHLAEGVASIMRIEAGSNVDKPHAISVNSMQSDTDEKRFKQTTLNDFVPSFPPLKKGVQCRLFDFKGEWTLAEECEICGTKEHLTSRGSKIICYGCEHEIFYADRDYELMTVLYGDE